MDRVRSDDASGRDVGEGESPEVPGRARVLASVLRAVDAGGGAIVSGPDGVGVSSVLRGVVQHLRAEGRPLVVGAEPGELPTGAVVVLDDAGDVPADVADRLASALLTGDVGAVLGCNGQRSAPVRRLGSVGGLVEVEVGPLDLAGVSEVIASLAGAPPGGITATALLDDSGGLPGLLVPVVRAALATGVLRADGGVVRRDGELPLPAAVRDRVQADISSLSRDAAKALELLAVAGTLDEAIARHGLGVAPLAELEQADLVVVDGRPPSPTVRPAVGVVGRVVRDGLGHYGRVAAAGELLERFLDAPPTQRTVWRLAGDADVSVDDLLDAAASATGRGDPATALQLCRAAFTDGGSRAGMALAEAMSTLGDRAGAAGVLEEVLDDPELAPVPRAQAALELATLRLWNLGDEAGALTLAHEVAAEANGTPLAAVADAALASMLAYVSRPDEALATVEPHLGDGGLGRGFVHHASAVALAVRGAGGRAVEEAEVARLAPTDGIGPDPEVHILTSVLAHELAGSLDRAGDLAQQGYARTSRLTVHHGWMALAATRVALVAGELREAQRMAVEAASVFGDLDNHAPRRWALAGVLLADAQLGDRAAAAVLEELDGLGPSALSFLEPDVVRARAWAMVTLGHLEAGRRLVLDAARAAEEAGLLALASTAWHDAVRLGGGREPARRLVALAEVLDSRWSRPRVLLAEGRAAGDVAQLLAAAQEFEDLGARVWAAESAALAESAARRSGQRGELRSARAVHRRLRASCADAVTPALADATVAALSPRERDVASLVCEGLSNREVAERLDISVRTVDNLLQRIYDKLGVRRREELRDALASEPM